MNKPLFLSFFLLLFIISSCSKDKKPLDIKENPPKSNQKTENSSNMTPASSYSSVKSSGDNVQKNEIIDFTWSENGNETKFSDFKGKVILLNFWATWCGPCRQEIPALSQISSELKDKDFKIIGVSIDRNKIALENYLKTNPIPYTVLHEPGDLLAKYMLASGNTDDVIPQSFIVDRNGKIAEAIIGSRSKSDFIKIINKYL